MNSNFLKNSLISALLISNSFIIPASDNKKTSDTIISDIEGISGSVPKRFHIFIEELKKLPTDKNIDNGFCNRLLFNGPPGNGKSTFAAKIAEATGSEFKLITGGSVVGPYTGMGSQAIDQIFKEALDITVEQKKEW